MENSLGRIEFETFNREYKVYVDGLKAQWLSQNQFDSPRVYEVMYPHEREEVHNILSRWSSHITPIAEDWWKQRGHGVIWPTDDSQPMQVYKLETAA